MLGWYRQPPVLINTKTLADLYEAEGLEGIFGSASIADAATQEDVYEYFKFDHLCTSNTDKFKWFLNRRILEAYPVYRDQLDAWAKRKTYDWFYDLEKGYKLTHDGTTHLDDKTLRDLERTAEETIKDIFAGKIVVGAETSGTDYYTDARTQESEADGTKKTTGTVGTVSHEEGTDSYTNSENGKNRGFNFVYPESNYSGGVVPYDLNDNPNVEFISTQQDGITSNTLDHEGEHETDSDSTVTTNMQDVTHDEATIDDNLTHDDKWTGKEDRTTTTDNTDDKTANELTNESVTGTEEQDTETHWQEVMERNEIKLNDLLKEILADLPATDFFRQFVRHLKPCFIGSVVFDEIDWEEEW